MLVEYVTWLARLIVCAVFAGAAWGKLTSQAATRRAVADFGVPQRYVVPVAWGVPVAEVAVALAVLPARSAVWGASAGGALLVVFSVAVARLLVRGQHPACACFGSAAAKPISPATLVRNAVLLVVIAVTVGGSLARPAIPGSLPVDHALGLAVVIALVIVQVRQHLVLTELRNQRVAGAQPARRGLRVGVVAPEFTVTALDDTPSTLTDLLAGARPVVLVFVHPGCGPCKQLAGELPRWQQRRSPDLDIVVISSGPATENTIWASQFGIEGVLLQQTNEVAARYKVGGIPSAVFIDASGRIGAAAAAGPDPVRELLATAATTVSDNDRDNP